MAAMLTCPTESIVYLPIDLVAIVGHMYGQIQQ